MRYVLIEFLKPGDINGKNIYSTQNTLLLSNGEVLTESKIKRLEALNYSGIYLTDSCSEGLKIKDVVSEKLRVKANNDLKKLFQSIEQNNPKQIQKSYDDIKEVVYNMVNSIMNNSETIINLISLKQYDEYTFSHSVNVGILSIVMGVSLKLNQHMLNELGVSGILHDIGKIFVDKKILNKEGRLTTEEYEEMKKHPSLGCDYVKGNKCFSKNVVYSVLMHHEKFDGSGYPSGAHNNQIPMFAKIISLADVYDAMVSDRPYRKGYLPSDAVEYIMSSSGKSFDPKIVESFMKSVAAYPTGTIVVLSNGKKGIVVDNTGCFCLRPKIKLIEDDESTNIYIDLSSDPNYYNVTIKEVIY